MSKLTPIDEPLLYADSFILHLYCKWNNPDHTWDETKVWEYIGSDRGVTFARARKAGWVLHKDHSATCPRCAKENNH